MIQAAADVLVFFGQASFQRRTQANRLRLAERSGDEGHMVTRSSDSTVGCSLLQDSGKPISSTRTISSGSPVEHFGGGLPGRWKRRMNVPSSRSRTSSLTGATTDSDQPTRRPCSRRAMRKSRTTEEDLTQPLCSGLLGYQRGADPTVWASEMWSPSELVLTAPIPVSVMTRLACVHDPVADFRQCIEIPGLSRLQRKPPCIDEDLCRLQPDLCLLGAPSDHE